MKKHKTILLAFLTAFILSATASCSGNTTVSSPETSGNGNIVTNQPSKNNGIAVNEISVNPVEEANANDTGFRLNRVIDSGQTSDSGEPYIYLDVTISNHTDKSYDLNVLNNFYILLANEDEVHFDVRTQLYGTKNISNYAASPFNIPANGEFSGIIGGFILPKDSQDFTVCFFPTQDDANNKSNVIKVNIGAQNIEKL